MAQELYKTMLPQIQEARQAGASICFAGHSLGGALAALLCSLTMLQQPTQNVTCTSFGSPPVLAHKDGKDGTAILEVDSVSSGMHNSHACHNIHCPVAVVLQLAHMLIVLPTDSSGVIYCHLQLSQIEVCCSCWVCQSPAYAALC